MPAAQGGRDVRRSERLVRRRLRIDRPSEAARRHELVFPGHRLRRVRDAGRRRASAWRPAATTPRSPAPSELNYGEVFLGVATDSVSARVYYSPRYFGESSSAVYGEINATQPLTERIRLHLHVGLVRYRYESPYGIEPRDGVRAARVRRTGRAAVRSRSVSARARVGRRQQPYRRVSDHRRQQPQHRRRDAVAVVLVAGGRRGGDAQSVRAGRRNRLRSARAQRLARLRESRNDRRHGHAQEACDLRVGQPLDGRQDEDLALLERERAKLREHPRAAVGVRWRELRPAESASGTDRAKQRQELRAARRRPIADAACICRARASVSSTRRSARSGSSVRIRAYRRSRGSSARSVVALNGVGMPAIAGMLRAAGSVYRRKLTGTIPTASAPSAKSTRTAARTAW